MKVFRITNRKFADDLSGRGAFLNGGRWNSEGIYALYTSSSASLALLETLAHLPNDMIDREFFLITIEIPEKFVSKFNKKLLPEHWSHYPFTMSTQFLGDKFIKEGKFIALSVPSSILEMENNILLNPLHPDFHKVKIISKEVINIDKRLRP